MCEETSSAARRTICWRPTWNGRYAGVGLEHLLLAAREANSVILAVDEERGPFRLAYRLVWDSGWRLRAAELTLDTEQRTQSLRLQTGGRGRWQHQGGRAIDALDGCVDIDIWPMPFTNCLPLWREPLAIGERREFRMAWVNALDMTLHPQAQAYTRLAQQRYRYETLDGSGLSADLPVDDDGIVLDYPGLFQRVGQAEQP